MFRRRPGYERIGKHWQLLNHQSIQSDLNGSEREATADASASVGEPQPDVLNSTVYKVHGYRNSTFRTILFHVVSIALCGLPYLFTNWFPAFINLKYRRSELKICDFVIISNTRGHTSIENVFTVDLCNTLAKFYGQVFGQHISRFTYNRQLRLFVFEHVRYIMNVDTEEFVRLQNVDETLDANGLLVSHNEGVTELERNFMLQLYGHNTIEIAVKSYWELFRSEVLNPFYLFQIFSITLWCLDDYWYYAGCVFFLSTVSIFTSLYETRKQSITLHDLIENLKTDRVTILDKDDELALIVPDDLVPGDLIVISAEGGIMPCDAILLSGSCIVNESMLTGESIPVTKTPPTVAGDQFDWSRHKRSILYAGTNILQTRYYGNEKVLAKVVRVGFETSKGELVKSILFPQPIGFRFYEDSIKFVLALFCIAAFGMIYCVKMYMSRNTDIETIVLRSLDIITIVIPPALPLAMTAGTVYSQARLRKLNIFCISPHRINVCGKLKMVCFDKTGTLTDDGLTMDGCVPCHNGEFQTTEPHMPNAFDNESRLIQALATCHSLTTINDTLSGDPLDIEMFQSIDWELIEPGEEHTRFDNLTPTIVRPRSVDGTSVSPLSVSDTSNIPYSIGIIKQHHFSSEAQCMTVIVRVLGARSMQVYTKGAPEKILTMCRPETVPDNFYAVLNRFTARGYRVIGIAHKHLKSKVKWVDVERMKRHEIETDMNFLGFLILLNSLKPETKHVIEELHAAHLRTVMITGDNIMTALSVAKECLIIRPNEDVYIIKHHENDKKPSLYIELGKNTDADHATNSDDSDSFGDNSEVFACLLSSVGHRKYHLAMDGNTWNVIQTHYSELIPNIVARGTIFSRFRPEQKSQIVLCLQKYDYIVAMCGDGANDCGALRAAHIGISLSQAEASVAAPFTSKEQNISCVKHLALEGRCALVTSFGLFKYMTMYSLIQFCTILILYSRCSILGNFQFLYIDLIITASLAFTMGRQGPAKRLVVKRPSSSLISLANVIPLLLQVLSCVAVQIGALIFLHDQDWFYNTSLLEMSPNCQANTTNYTTEASGFVENILCWENTVLFLVSCFQYLILGAVYSKGFPHRQPLYTNYMLITFAVVWSVTTSFMLLQPADFLANVFEIMPYNRDAKPVNEFRYMVLIFPLLQLMLSVFIEFLICDRRWFKNCLHFITRKSVPKNKFKKIELDVKESSHWLNILRSRESGTDKSVRIHIPT